MADLNVFCIRNTEIAFLELVGYNNRPRMLGKIHCPCTSHTQTQHSLCLYQQGRVISWQNVHCSLSEPEPWQWTWPALRDYCNCSESLRILHLGRNWHPDQILCVHFVANRDCCWLWTVYCGHRWHGTAPSLSRVRNVWHTLLSSEDSSLKTIQSRKWNISTVQRQTLDTRPVLPTDCRNKFTSQ